MSLNPFSVDLLSPQPERSSNFQSAQQEGLCYGISSPSMKLLLSLTLFLTGSLSHAITQVWFTCEIDNPHQESHIHLTVFKASDASGQHTMALKKTIFGKTETIIEPYQLKVGPPMVMTSATMKLVLDAPVVGRDLVKGRFYFTHMSSQLQYRVVCQQHPVRPSLRVIR